MYHSVKIATTDMLTDAQLDITIAPYILYMYTKFGLCSPPQSREYSLTINLGTYLLGDLKCRLNGTHFGYIDVKTSYNHIKNITLICLKLIDKKVICHKLPQLPSDLHGPMISVIGTHPDLGLNNK